MIPVVKVRAPQRRWVRFIQLERKEAFIWKNRGAVKVGGVTGFNAGLGDFWVWPWQKVRSFRPVKNLKNKVVAPKGIAQSEQVQEFIRLSQPGETTAEIQNQTGTSA